MKKVTISLCDKAYVPSTKFNCCICNVEGYHSNSSLDDIKKEPVEIEGVCLSCMVKNKNEIKKIEINSNSIKELSNYLTNKNQN